MRISDWSSDVCSSDLLLVPEDVGPDVQRGPGPAPLLDLLHRRQYPVLPPAFPGPAGHAASLSRLCGSLYLLAPYLVDRLCDHGRGHVLLLPEPRLCVRRGEEGGGQSVGRRCDDARMDAVEPAAVPPVQRTTAYRLTRFRPPAGFRPDRKSTRLNSSH